MSTSSLLQPTSRSARLFTWCLVSAALMGCAPSGPERKPVEGTVILNGKPATDLTIVFTPAGGGQLGAVAEVVDGQFRLSADSGPSQGKHHVTFDVMQLDLEEFEMLRQAGRRPFLEKNLHPKYTRTGTLEASVAEQGDNVFHFQLERK